MPDKPPTFRPRTAPGRLELRKRYDAKRQAQQDWRKWYNRAIWCHPVHGLRRLQLQRQPWCEICLAMDPPRHTPATIVHHRHDHKGDWALFIDPNNHASVCKPCHDSELQRGRAPFPARA